MEPTNILEQATSSEEAGVAYSEPKYSLNVVLVYQDTPTREWAGQVCDHVTRLAGDGVIHSTWCEIGRLGDSKVFTDAVLEAIRADVIMISIYDAKELPANLCVWIDAWLPCRHLSMGALIALISVPGYPGVQTDRTQDYLRATAHNSQLDFLLRERKLPVASRGFLYMERTKGTANPTTSIFREALSHDYNCDAMGVGFQSQQSNQNLYPPNQAGERPPDTGSLRIRTKSAALK